MIRAWPKHGTNGGKQHMQNAGSGKHATVCKNHAEHATSSSCGWDNIEQTFHLGCVKWAVGSKSTKTSLQENTSTSLSLLLLFNATITYWSYCCRRAGRSSSLYFHSKGATASGPFAMTWCDGQSLSLVISSNHWCGLKWFWSSWSSAYNLEGCTV